MAALVACTRALTNVEIGNGDGVFAIEIERLHLSVREPFPFSVPLVSSEAAFPVTVPSKTRVPSSPDCPANLADLGDVGRVDVVLEIRRRRSVERQPAGRVERHVGPFDLQAREVGDLAGVAAFDVPASDLDAANQGWAERDSTVHVNRLRGQRR